MGRRKGIAGEAVLDVLVDLIGDLMVSRPPLVSERTGQPPGLLDRLDGKDGTNALSQRPTLGAADQSEESPGEVDLAALPTGSLEVAFHRSDQSPMIITAHQIHAMQPTGSQLAETWSANFDLLRQRVLHAA